MQSLLKKSLSNNKLSLEDGVTLRNVPLEDGMTLRNVTYKVWRMEEGRRREVVVASCGAYRDAEASAIRLPEAVVKRISLGPVLQPAELCGTIDETIPSGTGG